VASRRYENFDLLVESAGDGTFRSRVAASPVGAGASATFAMPFDATGLENLLLKLDPGRSQMRRATADPRPKASTELGGAMFEAVFGEEVLLAWTRSQDATRDAGEGLRLRLQLTDAPEIAGLPWELLFDRRTNSYPAQSERTPLVRYLEVPHPPRPLTVDGPLRILVVLSSPTDLPELDVEAEWRRMQDMLGTRVASGAVQLDRLPSPTTTELAAWLRSHEVHVLHVDGVPAGFAELDCRTDEIELLQFGLMHEFIGQGLGKYFLQWTIDHAWSLSPRRLWLHTCTLDHPNALPNYQKAGFAICKEETKERPPEPV